MGTKVTLTAADGFQLGAYRADPKGPPRGGVVVIQEIFGVNHHIRAVCDRLADVGYRVMAPQVFDRMIPNFESGYSETEIAKARELLPRLDWAKLMLDASAAVDALKKEGGPVAMIGFCMGGTVAFIAATRLGGLAASVCYYGGQIIRYADSKPRCPVQMHFGEKDASIPMGDVETIRQKRPECEIFTYPGAGHAFNRDESPAAYEPNSAKLAWQRTLAFLAKTLGAARPKPAVAQAAKVAAPASARPAAKPKPKPAAKAKKRSKPKPKPKAKSRPKAKKRAKAKGRKRSKSRR
ncbi:MAG TPA: dienelactone hydrolase family protein [Xanthobacteraceae bacterium]|nr:dienelactone hydrolase family protein [Xanthobacteraceae bacterium]